MAALVRAKNWSNTPLGPAETWPQSLRVAIGICLSSRSPMFLWWGPDLITLYNDACAPILGRRHPDALGRSGRDLWREVWPVIGPQVEAVMARGEASWQSRVPLALEQNGSSEEAYLTWSHSPVPDDDGRVGGVLCVVTDETTAALAERERDRLAEERTRVDELSRTVLASVSDDLRAEQERFRALFERAAVGMAEVDLAGHFVRVNAEYGRITGYTPEELVGLPTSAITHPDDATNDNAMREAMLRQGGSGRREKRYVRKDGAIVWVDLAVTLVRDDAGRPTHLISSVADITTRKQAEEQLRRSHDTFYNLIQNNPFGVYVVDADFKLAQVSLGAQKVFANVRPLLGRDFAEVLREVWAEPFATEVIGRFRRTLATGEPYMSPSTVERRKGTAEVEAYDWRIERVPLPDGRSGVVCYFYDLSERQRWEAALRGSEARRATALAIAHLGTFDWDVRTSTVTLDDRSRAIFGFRPGEGTRAEEIFGRINPADVPRVRAAAEASRRDLSRLEIEYRVILPGGDVRSVVSINDVVPGSDGEAERMFGVFADVTERRRAEAAERDAVERFERQSRLFEQIATTTPDLIYVFDLSGRFLYANRRLLEVWGRTFEDAVGKSLYELDYPQWHADMHMAELRQVMETKQPIRGEVPFTGGSGISGVYEYIFTPVLGPDGEVEVIAGTTRDVTERKLAEEERRRLSAERDQQLRTFDTVLASLQELVYLLDPSGRFTYANKPLLDLWKKTPAEAFGKSFAELGYPPELVALHGAQVAEVVRTRQPVRGENAYTDPQGRPGYYEYIFVPLFAADGSVEAIGGATRDVTEQRRHAAAREELLAREQAARSEAETLVQVGRSLSAELDVHKLVQAATDAATALTQAAFGAFFYALPDAQDGPLAVYTISGMPKEEFAKLPMPRATDLFGPTLPGEAVIRSDDISADPRYGRNAPDHGMPEGHLPVRSYLAVPVRSRSGEVLGAMFLGHAEPGRFTERHERLVTGVVAHAAVAIDNARLYDRERAAREEAERQSRMKDEFLATLSHELRTPLNAILGWSQVLRSGGRTNAEDVRRGLETIERNARAQTRIIEDLLDMSRIISGKVRLDVQHVELASVIEAAVGTVRHAADTKGVRLQIVLDPDAGAVAGDPARLHQVFWNLLSNSVKHSQRGGRVQVVMERVSSHLEVSVMDDGEGIPPEFLPHVFDRFRQADSTTTRRHGGLGLGLSIVKQLVELHGGTVRARSPGVGQGATFTVTFPLTPVHQETEPTGEQRRYRPADVDASASLGAGVKLSGVRVLVVDDEPDARALVERLLKDCGAVVTTAASASEALEAVRRERPDVMVSDIGMPGEDGYSLIRKVRALGPGEGGDVMAVALTAYARSEDRTRAMLAGFQTHVAKPVEPTEIVAAVASLASRTGRH